MNNPSRVINSMRNVIWGLGNKVFVLVLNFILKTIFIQILGVEYLGINSLFADILLILSLADLGLNTAMVYSFYQPLAQKNKMKISALTRYYKKIYIIIASIVALGGLILLPFLKLIINLDQEIPNLEIYYLLYLLNSVVSYLFVYKSSIIIADQKNYLISLYSLIFSIAKMVLQIVTLIIWKNYIVYLFIQLFITMGNNLFISYKADQLYPEIKEKFPLGKAEKKEIFYNIKAMFLYKISVILLNGTTNILISVMVGTVWVGYYTNYNMIILGVSGFISTVFESFNASIGNLIVSADHKRRKEIFDVILFLSFWITGFAVTCIYITINDFITLWLGKEYVLNTNIIIAILSNFYLFCMLNPLWSFRNATGLFKKTQYMMLFAAGINLILSILLGSIWGMFGIIISAAMSRIMTYFWYEPILLFGDYFQSPAKIYFVKQFFGIIMVVMTSILANECTSWIKATTWTCLFLKVCIGTIVQNLIYFALFRQRWETKYLYQIIIKKK